MKIETNINLSSYTTFKMGGIAKKFYTPESKEEIIDLVRQLDEKYFIGGGSNILINDHAEYKEVVNLRKFDTSIQKADEGRFVVGASVRLQKLIQTINEEGYGGIEYLYSVPGLVGGAVTMNAGRGEKYNKSISDHIIEVEILHDNRVERLSKKECAFSYRSSTFKKKEYLILSVTFRFPEMQEEETNARKEERLMLCREKQDTSLPNFGTVFCISHRRIMRMMKNPLLGRKNGIRFSAKTSNWLLNCGNGSFADTVTLMRRTERIHKLLHKECKREVIIWE